MWVIKVKGTRLLFRALATRRVQERWSGNCGIPRGWRSHRLQHIRQIVIYPRPVARILGPLFLQINSPVCVAASVLASYRAPSKSEGKPVAQPKAPLQFETVAFCIQMHANSVVKKKIPNKKSEIKVFPVRVIH